VSLAVHVCPLVRADQPSLAYAEMRLLLAKMLWHFDFELADPAKQWYEKLRCFMIWEGAPLHIRLRTVRR
jgi:cytochrome P450